MLLSDEATLTRGCAEDRIMERPIRLSFWNSWIMVSKKTKIFALPPLYLHCPPLVQHVSLIVNCHEDQASIAKSVHRIHLSVPRSRAPPIHPIKHASTPHHIAVQDGQLFAAAEQTR